MIAAALVERARDVPIERELDRRSIKLKGRIERVGPCPVCGGRDRFAINIRKQVFHCRGCGAGGNVVALVQFLDACNFQEAVAALAGEEERAAPRKALKPNNASYERRQRAKAGYLWRASRPAASTPVETYLREARGIALPLPPTLRYLPALKPDHHPAMLAPYALPSEPEPGALAVSNVAAMQLTLLRGDGSGKAAAEPNKITIASPAGLPMVLAPVNDLLGLAICEGVEDALSVHQATGLGAWASGGASFMPKLAPAVPDFVESVTVFAHSDQAGQAGAYALAEALVARGIEVFVEGIAP